MKQPKPPKLVGLLEPGNVDYLKRPIVRHTGDNVRKYGNYSTTYSMSFEEDGKQVLIPTVSHDGRMMSLPDAVDYYRRTGEHLGKYDTPSNADTSAINIHNYQAQFYTQDGKPILGMGAVDTTRRKPFTELYPNWDAPTFNPTMNHLVPKPKSQTTNTNPSARIYESVLDDFSNVRQQQLRDRLKLYEQHQQPPTQTMGGNG